MVLAPCTVATAAAIAPVAPCHIYMSCMNRWHAILAPTLFLFTLAPHLFLSSTYFFSSWYSLHLYSCLSSQLSFILTLCFPSPSHSYPLFSYTLFSLFSHPTLLSTTVFLFILPPCSLSPYHHILSIVPLSFLSVCHPPFYHPTTLLPVSLPACFLSPCHPIPFYPTTLLYSPLPCHPTPLHPTTLPPCPANFSTLLAP